MITERARGRVTRGMLAIILSPDRQWDPLDETSREINVPDLKYWTETAENYGQLCAAVDQPVGQSLSNETVQNSPLKIER